LLTVLRGRAGRLALLRRGLSLDGRALRDAEVGEAAPRDAALLPSRGPARPGERVLRMVLREGRRAPRSSGCARLARAGRLACFGCSRPGAVLTLRGSCRWRAPLWALELRASVRFAPR
jgi:hypothetical protein